MNFSQETTVWQHGLTLHSKRKGWIICKESDGWAIIDPAGAVRFHLHSLAEAKLEIDYS